MDDEPLCRICESPMEWARCWYGCDDGFIETDDPEDGESDEECPECHGKGGYLQCVSLPHTDEQMAAWRAKAT